MTANLHWPFAAKHANCAECDREYEPPPTSDSARRAAEGVAKEIVSYLAGKYIEPDAALMEVAPIADIIQRCAATPAATEAATRLREFFNEDYTLIARHFKDTTKDRDITGDVEDLLNAVVGADNDAESSLLSRAVAVCKDLAEHVTQELTEQSDHPQRDILNYDDYRKGQIQAALEIESELRKLATTKGDR